jgi:hypothetical protein
MDGRAGHHLSRAAIHPDILNWHCLSKLAWIGICAIMGAPHFNKTDPNMSKPNHSQPAGHPRPRILVIVEGGLVTDILTDTPVEVRVVDYDNAGEDEESDTVNITQVGEHTEKASVADWSPTPTKRRINLVWRAINRQQNVSD